MPDLVTFLCNYKKRKTGKKMKIKRKIFGWAVRVFAVAMITGGTLWAADGDPDVKPEVRNASAIEKLKKRKDVSLLYVKGMT